MTRAALAASYVRRQRTGRTWQLDWVTWRNPLCPDDCPYCPDGLCHCGCGRVAPVARQSFSKRGWRKAQPTRYVWNHSSEKGGHAVQARYERDPEARARNHQASFAPEVNDRRSATMVARYDDPAFRWRHRVGNIEAGLRRTRERLDRERRPRSRSGSARAVLSSEDGWSGIRARSAHTPSVEQGSPAPPKTNGAGATRCRDDSARDGATVTGARGCGERRPG